MRLIHLPCLLLACLMAACASAAPLLQPVDGELPGINGLDQLRQPSIIESFRLSLVQPHSQFNCEPLDEERRVLKPTQDEHAWCIFQVPAPEGPLDSLIASGSGLFYIAAADFQLGRWRFFSVLSEGEALIDLSDAQGLISPGGFCYCVVLAPALKSGGMQSQLDSLALVYDEEHGGNTFYVAPVSSGGNDNNPGSVTLPWGTLQKAADNVVAGDTVIVRPGNYEGFMLSRSGMPGSPITFSALDGAAVIFDNVETPDGINIENFEAPDIHDIVVEGFTVRDCSRAGIRVVGSAATPAHDIILRHNNCTGNARWGIFSGFTDRLVVEYNTCSFSGDEHGIYLSNSGDENIARGNVCFSNKRGGIQFNADASQGGDGIMSGALIERNVCFDNGSGGGAALNMDGLRDSVIRNNLLYGNHASGITLFSQDGLTSTGNLVVCNTIVQADNGRWCIRIANASTGNTLRNNILWNRDDFRGAISLDADCLAGFSSDYNLAIGRFTPDDDDNVYDLADWFANTGNDQHSIEMTDEAVFLNSLIDDYHILPGSLATELGTDILGFPPLDFDGNMRPQPVFDGLLDAGCYEATE
ncbi:right-handed parallel beta-helix repeat-containing protein [bacterium]|nr:right-handed parallel beta-helix repeat-containing protein [bacterium]